MWWQSVPRQQSEVLSICVWTKDMTIRQDTKLSQDTAISRIFGELGRRNWIREVTNAILRVGGWWNERWGGYLIPFQCGYAVNVISESYIVIPAKAGIHTGWLGRIW